MIKKMKALKKNETWEFVSITKENCWGMQMASSIKYKSDGSIEKDKARLLAKALLKDMELTIKMLLA